MTAPTTDAPITASLDRASLRSMPTAGDHASQCAPGTFTPTPDTQPTHSASSGRTPANSAIGGSVDAEAPTYSPASYARWQNAERRAERLQERADALSGRKGYHAMLGRLNTAREACLIAHSELQAVTHG